MSRGRFGPRTPEERLAASQALSPEARARISAAKRGYKHTEAAKAAIGAARVGIPRSPETREKIAASKRGVPRSPEVREKIAAALRVALALKRKAHG